VSGLPKKLRITEGTKALVIQGPKHLMSLLGDLPPDAKVSTRGRGPFPVVIAFVTRQRELEKTFRQARAALAPGGVLWIGYPKKSSGVATDISRDDGWDTLAERGWVPVSQVAVDETWSALRFKHDPALKTLRTNRRLKKRSESPTIKLKRSDLRQTVKLRAGGSEPPTRKRRREAATVSLRGPGAKPQPKTRKKPSSKAMKAVVRTPEDLAEALAERPDAKKRWSRLPPADKREHLDWIDEVKRADARARRIAKTVDALDV